MATDSRTWFYSVPEPRPYYIEERVNQTLWKNRLQTLYMTCTQATAPIKMQGQYHGQPISFEWQPGKYFTLRTRQEEKALVGVLRQVLMMPPAFTYHDNEGSYTVEWHTDGGEDRWAQVQGNPAYVGAKRIKARRG